MGIITYKKIDSIDPLFFHVLRLRFEGYFTGKNKTMDLTDEHLGYMNGREIMKKDRFDEYSDIYLFFYEGEPIGTVRYTIHRGGEQQAPMAAYYPDITNEHERTGQPFMEASRAAIKESFRGKSLFLLFVYYLGGIVSFENDCTHSYFECPKRLAEVYNQYLGAEIPYLKPRYYPSNHLALYLAHIKVGESESAYHSRNKLFFYALGNLLKLQNVEAASKVIFPVTIALRKMFLINEKKVDLNQPVH